MFFIRKAVLYIHQPGRLLASNVCKTYHVRLRVQYSLPDDEHKVLETRRSRGELSYLAPLGSENISAPYFKQCFFRGGGGYYPPD